jgi:hypothetical protein
VVYTLLKESQELLTLVVVAAEWAIVQMIILVTVVQE